MAIKGGDPILEKQNWSNWFFALCAVMFFCYGASIYQEFISRRTYIIYQERFQKFDHAKTAREFEAFKTGWTSSEAKAAKEGDSQADLQKKVDEAKAKLGSGEYKQLKDDRWTAFLAVGYNKSERAKAKSKLDADFYTWKNTLHISGAEAEKAPEAAYHEQETVVNDWTAKLDAASKKLDAIDQQLKAYDGAVFVASKAYDNHMEPYQKYVEKLDKIDHRSVRTIDQIRNDRLGIGGAYTFGTVDRCRSCHMAIDKPGYEEALFDKLDPADPDKKYKTLFSTHPDVDPLFTKHPVDSYGCTVCHQGNGRATRIVTPLGGDPDNYVGKEQADQVHGYTTHGGEDFPLYKGDYVQASCQRCHAAQRWLDDAPVYEKGKDLFITKGCAGCHTIKGYEDLPRIAPELTHIKGKVTPEWLVQWVTNPKAFYPETRMPAFVFNPIAPGQDDPANNVAAAMDPKTYPADRAKTCPDGDRPDLGCADLQMDTVLKIAAYLWQSSEDDPPGPFGKYPGGGNAATGRQVVETVGCIGCHAVGEKGEKGNHRAPPLYKAGAKMASEDWIWNWIRQPRWHAATTVMPQLRLTDSEAKDVVAYLWEAGKAERKAPDGALRAKLEDKSLAAAGSKLISGYGCSGCHLVRGSLYRKNGTVEYGQLVSDISGVTTWTESKGGQVQIKVEEIDRKEEHEKDGRIAPELTLFAEKKPLELAFGDSKTPETWLAWTKGKLANPRQYVDIRGQSRMPWFNLDEKEIHALSVYLTGQKDPRVPEDMKKQFTGKNATIERGRALVNYYNCVGCHTIEGRGGEILTWNKGDDNRALQPPNLNKEGLKIQADFLREFIKNPTPIRPWLHIRMPTFPLTDDQRADIISYFRAVDGVAEPYDPPTDVSSLDPNLVKRGQLLFANKGSDHPMGYNCQNCHVFHGERRSSAVEANVAPDLANVWRRFRPDGVSAWLTSPSVAMPGTKMPSFFFDDSEPGKLTPNAPDSAEQVDAVREFLFSLAPAGKPTAMNTETAPAASHRH